MCSCFRNITCCWEEQVSSKQEEVAENERNHPYIISAPGYVNAAFEDVPSPVVSQPQHCDITIEAPPRELPLLATVPHQTTSAPGTCRNSEVEYCIADDKVFCSVGPSTSAAADDLDQPDELWKSSKDQGNNVTNPSVISEEHEDLESTSSCSTGHQQTATAESENETSQANTSNSFHWHPIIDSQVSEVESTPEELESNSCDVDDITDSEHFQLPQIQPRQDLSIDSHEVPGPSVPNNFANMSCCNSIDLNNTTADASTQNVAGSDIPNSSINRMEELPVENVECSQDQSQEDLLEDASVFEESAYVSLITIVHDEDDSLCYHSLRPKTGVSMESVDSAISMGSSPTNADGMLSISSPLSSSLPIGSFLDVQTSSVCCDDSISLGDLDRRPRFLSITSVSTSLTDLENDGISVDVSRRISDADDHSDGELDVSDGEVSVTADPDVFLYNDEVVDTEAKDSDVSTDKEQQHSCNESEDANKLLRTVVDSETVFDTLHSHAEINEECLTNQADETLEESQDDSENGITFDKPENNLVDQGCELVAETFIQDPRATDLKDNPSENTLHISAKNEPKLPSYHTDSTDIPGDKEVVNCDYHHPLYLKELAINKLVDVLYTASHTHEDIYTCDTEHILTNDVVCKDQIRDMLKLPFNKIKSVNDFPEVLTRVMGKTFMKDEKQVVSDHIALSESLEAALQSDDRTEIQSALLKLLELGCTNELSTTKGDSCNLISLAAKGGHTCFFEVLTDNDIEFSIKDAQGYYPIHYAVMGSYSDLLEFCVQQGQLQSQTDTKDNALHLAVLEGDIRFSRALADASKLSSTSLDTPNRDGQTPLHLAVVAGHADIVRCLIYNDFNVNSTNSKGLSLVMLAAHKQQFEIVEILLSNGASPLTEDAEGNNILHYFVSSRAYLMLDVVLAHYFPRDAIDNQNIEGQSALHTAAMTGDEVAVLSLLNHGANVDLPDQDGRTGLLLCATECQASLVTTLVTLGANPHHQDKQGCNILHYTAKTGNGTVTDFLVHQCEVNPNVQNNRGQTPLHVAAHCVHSDVVAVLLSASVKLDITDNISRTPLHEACCQGNLTIVAQLVYGGAKVNLRDEDNMTPLVAAGLRRAVDVIQYLISKENDSESLYDLAKFALPEDIHFLKNYNVDFDKQDKNGNTALHHAIINHNEQVAKLLIDSGVSTSLVDNQGNLVLHLACASASVEMIDLLIKSSCLIDSHNKKGETPAYVAAVEKRYHILTLLVRNGANLNTKLRDGRTLVFVAVEHNDAELTELLMSHGADVNYVCSGNMARPIHVAAKSGHEEVMAILLKSVTEVDIPEFFSRKTPLHFAAEGGWREVTLQLLTAGADVNLETGCGEKPIHLAAREGHADTVEALLQAGTQLSLLDEDGCPRYDLSRHHHVWTVIKAWALQHPSAVSSHRRLPAALASLRSVIREAFRVSRTPHSAADALPPYS